MPWSSRGWSRVLDRRRFGATIGRMIFSTGTLPSLPRVMLAAALLLALADRQVPAAPPTYRAVPIAGVVGPSAINEAGTVVGTNTSPLRAWVSHRGATPALLPLPPGMASSWANDVNDAGVVVGAAGPQYSPEFGGKAVAWIPTRDGYQPVLLGTLPGHSTSNATALNDVGDVVGFSSNGTYRTPVRFPIGSAPTSLAATGIFDPQDVNDSRVVVDRSFTTKRLDLDTMQVEDLGTPGAGYLATTATAINASGRICGLAIRASTTCDREAAEHDDEVGWRILSQCGPSNAAQDLNDLGDLVMSVQLVKYVRFADEGTYAIESLIEDAEGPWYSFTFTGLSINSSREIALDMSHPSSGFAGAVLLVPIGPPEDLDHSGEVDAADLTLLLAAWGDCRGCAADLDQDGVVGGGDLARLLAAWGAVGR